MNRNNLLEKLILPAVIGALYAALTMLLAPISYGTLQFRISEALCVLPVFFPYTSVGLFLGCALANTISAAGILDVVFGSLATLGACLCVAAIGKGRGARSWTRCILAVLMPVVWNAVIVGAVLMWTLTETAFPSFSPVFWVFAGEVGAGELAVMLVLGLPLLRLLPKNKKFTEIAAQYR